MKKGPLPRFIDKSAALALSTRAPLPGRWRNYSSPREYGRARPKSNGFGTAPAVALGQGSVDVSKRRTYYPEAARLLIERGLDVWVVGGPGEKRCYKTLV